MLHEPDQPPEAGWCGGDIAALGLAVISAPFGRTGPQNPRCARSSIWTMPLLRNAGSPCNDSCRPSGARPLADSAPPRTDIHLPLEILVKPSSPLCAVRRRAA